MPETPHLGGTQEPFWCRAAMTSLPQMTLWPRSISPQCRRKSWRGLELAKAQLPEVYGHLVSALCSHSCWRSNILEYREMDSCWGALYELVWKGLKSNVYSFIIEYCIPDVNAQGLNIYEWIQIFEIEVPKCSFTHMMSSDQRTILYKTKTQCQAAFLHEYTRIWWEDAFSINISLHC